MSLRENKRFTGSFEGLRWRQFVNFSLNIDIVNSNISWTLFSFQYYFEVSKTIFLRFIRFSCWFYLQKTIFNTLKSLRTNLIFEIFLSAKMHSNGKFSISRFHKNISLLSYSYNFCVHCDLRTFSWKLQYKQILFLHSWNLFTFDNF